MAINDSDRELQTPPAAMTPEGSESGEHPFWRDLNPDFLQGQNDGDHGPQPQKTAATAYDVKDLHNRLNEFEDDDLKQIPILPPGSRLEQGATYTDLRQSNPTELRATGDMTAGGDNWYVPKASVPYWIWNKLIGVETPQRLDQS